MSWDPYTMQFMGRVITYTQSHNAFIYNYMHPIIILNNHSFNQLCMCLQLCIAFKHFTQIEKNTKHFFTFWLLI